MRNRLIYAALIFFLMVVPAAAHPLGNFSINNFSRLEVEKNAVKIFCALDMAEIPTFQEFAKIDADGDKNLAPAELAAYAEKLSPEYLKNLSLMIDGAAVELVAVNKNAGTSAGAGDLPVLRVEMLYTAKLPSSSGESRRIEFANKNFADRLGWNEIIVNHAENISVFNSTAFADSLSNELRAYPEDLLMTPLAERRAEFSFTVGATVPANAKPLQNRNGQLSNASAPKDRFAALIAVPEITPTIILLGLLIAFSLGAAHALSPGHGKAVVGAYLVGSKGTPKHAAFLGLTVTITHTLGVFALGLITLFAANFILPERIMPFLNFVSGLLVFFIGVSLFKDRLMSALGFQTNHHHHHHDHEHDHHHHHEHGHHHHHEHTHHEHGHTHSHGGHTHSHLPPEDVTWKSLLALGISGGLLPCPSALVLMLSAISLGRVGYGLVLTLAFSLGLAATLTAVGLAFLYLGKIFDRPGLSENRIVKTLPVFSAFVIACIGAVMCYNSLA
jgi:nickel/cobalt transporter (NicO) family protein